MRPGDVGGPVLIGLLFLGGYFVLRFAGRRYVKLAAEAFPYEEFPWLYALGALAVVAWAVAVATGVAPSLGWRDAKLYFTGALAFVMLVVMACRRLRNGR